ncbi:MAG: hypothetical protein ACREDV_02520 [Methylocella sp.]
MGDPRTVTYSGQGSRREAARLGATIGAGVASALAGGVKPLHIDALRVQAPAGASKAEIERAIRAAIARSMKGGRK